MLAKMTTQNRISFPTVRITATTFCIVLMALVGLAQTGRRANASAPSSPSGQSQRDAAEARRLNQLGDQLLRQGSPKEALQFFLQALPLRRSARDQNEEAITLNNIGAAQAEMGHQQAALESYQQALEIYRALRNLPEIGNLVSNIGVTYYEMGQYDSAIEYHREGLDIANRVDDIERQATALNNLGVAYNAKGSKDDALRYFAEALPRYQRLRNPGSMGLILGNMGSIYKDQGEKKKAREALEKSLQYSQQADSALDYSNALNTLGLLELSEKTYPRVLLLFTESRDISLRRNYPMGVAQATHNTGLYYVTIGEKKQGLSFYETALQLFQQIHAADRVAKTQKSIEAVKADLASKVEKPTAPLPQAGTASATRKRTVKKSLSKPKTKKSRR